MVNFFASTCIPCKKEMPALQRVHERLGDDVTFVGIAVQDDPEAAQDLIDQTGVSYDLGQDPTGSLFQGFGGVVLPITAFVAERRHGDEAPRRRADRSRRSPSRSATTCSPAADVDGGRYGLALTAGMLATVNPCGLPMLPAYLSFFISDGSDDERSPFAAVAAGRWSWRLFVAARVPRRVRGGRRPGQLGHPRRLRGDPLGHGRRGRWCSSASGWPCCWAARSRCRSPGSTGAAAPAGLGSMFVFGVSYAIASISCTLPVFLAQVSSTLGQPTSRGASSSSARSRLGMALVLVALSVSLALARTEVVHALRRSLPMIGRVAGGFLVAGRRATSPGTACTRSGTRWSPIRPSTG